MSITLLIAVLLASLGSFYGFKKIKAVRRARHIKDLSRLRRIKTRQFITFTEDIRHRLFKTKEIQRGLQWIIDQEAKLSEQGRGFNNWFAPAHDIQTSFEFEDWLRSDLTDYLVCLAVEDLKFSPVEAGIVSILAKREFTPDNLRQYALDRRLTSSTLKERPLNNTMRYCLAIDSDKDVPQHPGIAYLLYQLYNFAAIELIYSNTRLPRSEFDTITDHNTVWQTAFLAKDLGRCFPILKRSNEDFARFVVDNLKTSSANNNDSQEKKDSEAKAIQPEDLSKDPRSLDELMAELNSLPGLYNVKKEISSLLDTLKIDQLRQKNNLEPLGKRAHFVFTGNPGTGKTTVARLIAKIYGKLNLLSKSTFLEVDRSDLVAGYVGQTALKVKDVLSAIKGGVLFIDEAYSLAPHTENDFGPEAISTLLNGIENNRDDLVVIVAGYQEPMKSFINSNPGLRSRFTIFIDFPDYTPSDLFSIFQHMANEKRLVLPQETKDRIQDYITKIHNAKDKTFANGRTIRTILEQLITILNTRLAAIPEETPLTPDDLMTILPIDITQLTQQDDKFRDVPKPAVGF